MHHWLSRIKVLDPVIHLINSILKASIVLLIQRFIYHAYRCYTVINLWVECDLVQNRKSCSSRVPKMIYYSRITLTYPGEL